MIQFKAAYFNKATRESKSVLVQFDGVLLHIWQITDPFCRLLTSDVFTLQPAFGKGKRYIKLPNGGKIVTDDIDAFSSLYASRHSITERHHRIITLWRYFWVIGAGAALAGILILMRQTLT